MSCSSGLWLNQADDGCLVTTCVISWLVGCFVLWFATVSVMFLMIDDCICYDVDS